MRKEPPQVAAAAPVIAVTAATIGSAGGVSGTGVTGGGLKSPTISADSPRV